MSPPPSKSLIWSHEPITSPREIAAIDNFHQLPDAIKPHVRDCSTEPTNPLLNGELTTFLFGVGTDIVRFLIPNA